MEVRKESPCDSNTDKTEREHEFNVNHNDKPEKESSYNRLHFKTQDSNKDISEDRFKLDWMVIARQGRNNTNRRRFDSHQRRTRFYGCHTIESRKISNKIHMLPNPVGNTRHDRLTIQKKYFVRKEKILPVLPPIISYNSSLVGEKKETSGHNDLETLNCTIPEPISNKTFILPQKTKRDNSNEKEVKNYHNQLGKIKHFNKITYGKDIPMLPSLRRNMAVQRTVLPPIRTYKDGPPLGLLGNGNLFNAPIICSHQPHYVNPRAINIDILPLQKQNNSAHSSLDLYVKSLISGASQNSIESDSRQIEILTKYAKEKDWSKVWGILGSPHCPKNEHLVNVICDGYEWGLLHQAVFQNNCEAVEKLISFPGCDPSIQTKNSKLEFDESERWDVASLAKSIECTTCITVISKALSTFKKGNLNTYSKQEHVNKSFPLLSLIISTYKQTFHPEIVNRRLIIIEVLGNIFKDMNSSDSRWLRVQELVCLSIRTKCKEKFEAVQESTSRDGFYKALIDIYTTETNSYLYSSLNEALRRQKKNKYQPTALDLELGPFILVFQIILLFWESIQKDNGVTYRRMLLTNEDLNMYQEGVKFSWMTFVSSAHDKNRTLNFPTNCSVGDNIVDFRIDNSEDCIWQPRNIEPYTALAESERTYPAGATFQVTKREKRQESTVVELKLVRE